MSHLSRRTLFQASAGAALLPAMGVLRTASAAPMVMQEMATDAWSFMNADARFTAWVRLIAAGGLENGARGATQYTAFVPTDEALQKYPAIQALLNYQNQIGNRSTANFFPDTSKIVQLIRSHIVLGKHYPSEATGGVMTVTSVAGTPISVDTGKSPATVTWTSVVTGTSLTAAITEAPINTINAVLYPVSAIGVSM